MNKIFGAHYGPEKLIPFAAGHKCWGRCDADVFMAALHLATRTIGAACANPMCPAYGQRRSVRKQIYLRDNWPEEPYNRSHKKRRDKAFEVTFSRREFVFARDEECAHCARALSHEVDPEETDIVRNLRQSRYFRQPFEMAPSLFDGLTDGVSFHAANGAGNMRPMRRPINEPQIDHIVPCWLIDQIADSLNASDREFLVQVAVVASCRECNGKRQTVLLKKYIRSQEAANFEIAAFQRLFVRRVLSDPTVDPVLDVIRFSRVLEVVRLFLTGQLSHAAAEAN